MLAAASLYAWDNGYIARWNSEWLLLPTPGQSSTLVVRPYHTIPLNHTIPSYHHTTIPYHMIAVAIPCSTLVVRPRAEQKDAAPIVHHRVLQPKLGRASQNLIYINVFYIYLFSKSFVGGQCNQWPHLRWVPKEGHQLFTTVCSNPNPLKSYLPCAVT